MKTQDFMNTVYDMLTQNETTTEERRTIFELVDYVDLDNNTINFINTETGKHFELRLVETFAPAPYKGGTL